MPIAPPARRFGAPSAAGTAKKVSAPSTTSFGYKTHVIIGRRADDGSVKVVQDFDHMPTQDEIKKATTGTKYPYSQFAICSASGFWDTVEKPKTPLW